MSEHEHVTQAGEVIRHEQHEDWSGPRGFGHYHEAFTMENGKPFYVDRYTQPTFTSVYYPDIDGKPDPRAGAVVQHYRNPNTGEHHRALLFEGLRFVVEECGFDAMKDEEPVTQEEAEAAEHCGHCWLEPGE